MRRWFMASVGVGLLLTMGPVLAHHSFQAEYDAYKPVNFPEATIAKVEWINPHSWIHIDVKKPDGTVERWMIEVNTPSSLARRGISRDTLKPGMVLGFVGYQALDGSLRASGRDILYPDGRRVLVTSSGAGAPPADAGAGDQK